MMESVFTPDVAPAYGAAMAALVDLLSMRTGRDLSLLEFARIDSAARAGDQASGSLRAPACPRRDASPGAPHGSRRRAGSR